MKKATLWIFLIGALLCISAIIVIETTQGYQYPSDSPAGVGLAISGLIVTGIGLVFLSNER